MPSELIEKKKNNLKARAKIPSNFYARARA